MSLPSPLEGLTGVRWTALAGLRAGEAEFPEATQPAARSMAATTAEVVSAGQQLGLSGLERLWVRGPGGATVVALRKESLLVAELEAGNAASRVEQALLLWTASTLPTPPSPGAAAQGGLPAQARSEAVFSGRLAVFALPDLLEFLRSGRRTGVLKISSGSRSGALRFHSGWITGASSPASPGVVALLVSGGWLAPAEAQSLESSAGPGALDAGEAGVLVRKGLVPAPAMEQALHEQAEVTLRELVLWKDGTFVFSRENEGESSVQVDAQRLLLDLYRQLDEAGPGRRGPR